MITNLELVRKLKKVGGPPMVASHFCFQQQQQKNVSKFLFPKVKGDSPGFVDIRFPSKEVTGTKYVDQ